MGNFTRQEAFLYVIINPIIAYVTKTIGQFKNNNMAYHVHNYHKDYKSYKNIEYDALDLHKYPNTYEHFCMNYGCHKDTIGNFNKKAQELCLIINAICDEFCQKLEEKIDIKIEKDYTDKYGKINLHHCIFNSVVNNEEINDSKVYFSVVKEYKEYIDTLFQNLAKKTKFHQVKIELVDEAKILLKDMKHLSLNLCEESNIAPDYINFS